jgi:hypothetical protein
LVKKAKESSGQGIAVKNDRIHGKAGTSVEALGAVVGGIGGDRGSVGAFLPGLAEKCCH